MRAPTEPLAAAEWYFQMQVAVTKLESEADSPNKIEKLQNSLFKFGMRYPHSDPRWNDLYSQVRQLMMRSPNHLQYLTEKIETERAKVADHPYHSGTRNSFNTLRVDLIRDTLCHLPSPATVKVLGNYLSDERDKPPPRYRGQDWIDSESNAYQACTALEKIGLRNAPVPPRSVQSESNLATWRLWWAQVEAGTRAFSFEGEEVEYRFRKDGKWESAPRGSSVTSVAKRPAVDMETMTAPSSSRRWLYVFAGILAGVAWLRWRTARRS